ncbi:MAG: DinB superfamily protein [Thalassobius sp.]|nr:DinB superfamily protein [Thalassovita sp.]
MMIESLKELFNRDLKKLKHELSLYQDDSTIWKIENSISNSGGNLCLHLIGNLKTYIGNGLAKTTYIRQRELEFSAKFVDREEIYKQIDETIEVVSDGLSQLTEEDLKGNFPIIIWEKETGMGFTLMHLHSHLNYHLGQINYHRRILEKG